MQAVKKQNSTAAASVVKLRVVKLAGEIGVCGAEDIWLLQLPRHKPQLCPDELTCPLTKDTDFLTFFKGKMVMGNMVIQGMEF